ncbi:MAG: hypothetical protein ACX93U_11265 [Salipiger thiooxidans]|uniref:hypothetical protein n=1 Tax=Salipiger thiooxidans TaxID=282683 RepID=UPI001CF96E1D|nr:hypothetical protein [Salipiger thiooxidans]
MRTRLAIAPGSPVGRRLAECGFEVFERDDGMFPEGPNGLYDEYGALGYYDDLPAPCCDGDNPSHIYASSARTRDGAQIPG